RNIFCPDVGIRKQIWHRRHYSDDGSVVSAKVQNASENVRVAAELPLPEALGNDYLDSVRVVLLRGVEPAEQGPHPKHGKEIVGNTSADHRSWLALPNQGVSEVGEYRSEVFKRVALLFVVLEIRARRARFD